jgi:hypothetical protein
MKLRRIIERDHGVIQVPPTRWRITLGFLSVLSVPLRLGRAKVSPPASFARFLWRGSTFGGFASGCRIGTPLADVAARHPFATTPTQLGHRSGDRGPSRPQSGRTDKLAKAANLD